MSSDFVFKHPNYIYSLARSCLHHSRSPWTDGHFEASSVSFGSSFEWRRRGAVRRRRRTAHRRRCEVQIRAAKKMGEPVGSTPVRSPSTQIGSDDNQRQRGQRERNRQRIMLDAPRNGTPAPILPEVPRERESERLCPTVR